MAVAKIVTGTELFPARINSVQPMHTLLANTVPHMENHAEKKRIRKVTNYLSLFSFSFFSGADVASFKA